MKQFLKRAKIKILIIMAVVGPGIITAFADNDAGGVATYSVAASKFGYSMLATIIPITVVLIITQEIGSRLAIVTGKGLGDLIREKFGIRVSVLIFSLLFFVNFGVIIQNIGGLKDGLSLFNLNLWIFLPVVIAFLFFFITKASYAKVEKFFLFLIVLSDSTCAHLYQRSHTRTCFVTLFFILSTFFPYTFISLVPGLVIAMFPREIDAFNQSKILVCL
jgi:Mn2+/Fe2+ NRAMP family transporter